MPKVSKHPGEWRIKTIDKRYLKQEWRQGIYYLIDTRTGETLTTSTLPLDKHLKANDERNNI